MREHPKEVLAYAARHGYDRLFDITVGWTTSIPLSEIKTLFEGRAENILRWVSQLSCFSPSSFESRNQVEHREPTIGCNRCR